MFGTSRIKLHRRMKEADQLRRSDAAE